MDVNEEGMEREAGNGLSPPAYETLDKSMTAAGRPVPEIIAYARSCGDDVQLLQ